MPKRPDASSDTASPEAERPAAKAKPGNKPAKKPASARTPNSKATKPELKPLEGYLADLLNPAINRGTAVPGGASGFKDTPQAGYEARPGDAGETRKRKLSKKADAAFAGSDGETAASLTAQSLQALLETGSPFRALRDTPFRDEGVDSRRIGPSPAPQHGRSH